MPHRQSGQEKNMPLDPDAAPAFRSCAGNFRLRSAAAPTGSKTPSGRKYSDAAENRKETEDFAVAVTSPPMREIGGIKVQFKKNCFFFGIMGFAA